MNNTLLNLGLRYENVNASETLDRILSIVYNVYESELDRLTSFNNIVRKVECFYGVTTTVTTRYQSSRIA